jgi:hypothetical protein
MEELCALAKAEEEKARKEEEERVRKEEEERKQAEPARRPAERKAMKKAAKRKAETAEGAEEDDEGQPGPSKKAKVRAKGSAAPSGENEAPDVPCGR